MIVNTGNNIFVNLLIVFCNNLVLRVSIEPLLLCDHYPALQLERLVLLPELLGGPQVAPHGLLVVQKSLRHAQQPVRDARHASLQPSQLARSPAAPLQRAPSLRYQGLLAAYDFQRSPDLRDKRVISQGFLCGGQIL